MPEQWFIKTKSGQKGPFSLQQLQSLADARTLHPNAGVRLGEERWTAAYKIPSLNFSPRLLAEAKQTRTDLRNRRTAEFETRIRTLQQELDDQAIEYRRKLQAREQAFAEQLQQLEFERQESKERRLSFDEAQMDLKAREQELRLATEKLTEWEAELTQKEKQLREQQAEYAKQTEIVASQQSELNEQRIEFENRKTELEADLSQRESQVKQASEAAEAEIERQLADVDQRVADLEEQKNAIETAQAELSDQAKTLGVLEESLAERESKTLEQENAIALRAEELEKLASELNAQKVAFSERTANDVDEDLSRTEVSSRIYESLANPDEKQKLLQDFASRQESLAHREAELIRREAELTERELSIASSGDDPSLDGPTETQSANALLREEATLSVDPSNDPPLATKTSNGSTKHGDPAAELPSTWEEVLGASDADDLFVEQIREAGEKLHDSGEKASRQPTKFSRGNRAMVTKPAEPGLSAEDAIAFRQQLFIERFGEFGKTYVDPDESMRVDVSVYQPDGERQMHTLVTNGMSDYPIPMPNGQRSVRAELLLYMTQVEEHAVEILRAAAKIPFRKKQGLSIGTTGSNGELRTLLAGSNQEDCVYMLPVIESDSKPLPAREMLGSSIQLFWMVTISTAERKLIENQGIHKFLPLLEKFKHSVYFDLMRDCYVKRKSWFRR